MHPFASHRQGIVERQRVGKILADDKSADKSMIQKAVSRHEARLHEGEAKTKLAHGGKISGKMSHGRLDKPHRARGGRVKAPVEVNVVIASKDKSPMPGMGMGTLPPAPVPAPGPVGAPSGPPAGPGLPPGLPAMMRKRGGRVGRESGGSVSGKDSGDREERDALPNVKLERPSISELGRPQRKRGGRVTSAKAESMKNATPVQNTPGGKITKPSDFTDWPPITKARGGRVGKHMTAGAATGEGRLEKIDWYGGRKKG